MTEETVNVDGEEHSFFVVVSVACDECGLEDTGEHPIPNQCPACGTTRGLTVKESMWMEFSLLRYTELEDSESLAEVFEQRGQILRTLKDRGWHLRSPDDDGCILLERITRRDGEKGMREAPISE